MSCGPFLIAAMFFIAACGSNSESITDEVSDDDIMHIMMSRATGDGSTTYRVMLHSQTGVYERQGTYRDLLTHGWLTPCNVNDKGKVVMNTDDTEYGLRYGQHEGIHYITFNSPAVPMTSSTTLADSSLYNYTAGACGYKISRVPVTDEDTVRFSDPVYVENTGVYLSDSTGYYYNYDASGHKMHERRCKLKINVECGSNITYCTVKSLKIKDIINEAYYEPGVTKHVEGSTSPNDVFGDFAYDKTNKVADIPLITGDAQTLNSGSSLNITGGDDGKNYIWLFPMDYEATVSGSTERWHPVPTLELLVTIGSETTERTYAMPLPYKLEPQTEYNIRMIVNTVGVHVGIDSKTWDDGGTNKIEVNPAPELHVDLTISDWEKGGGGTTE